MEQTASPGVSSPHERNAVTHKRRSRKRLSYRLRLAHALAPILGRMTHEEARLRIGDSDSSKAQCRKDVTDIKSRKASRIDRTGWERFLFIAERLGVDTDAALVPGPSGTVH